MGGALREPAPARRARPRAFGRSTGSAAGEHFDYAEAAEHLLDPNVLTLGFARRIASYKRLHLLVDDPGRALALLDGDRPVQFFFAGKAHPMDEKAKGIVRDLFRLKGAPGVAGRVAFLEDYDAELAAEMVAGCDVWINVPRPPQEASGTSGMKAAINGVINLSVLDGWWAEAYDGTNGWAIDGDTDRRRPGPGPPPRPSPTRHPRARGGAPVPRARRRGRAGPLDADGEALDDDQRPPVLRHPYAARVRHPHLRRGADPHLGAIRLWARFVSGSETIRAQMQGRDVCPYAACSRADSIGAMDVEDEARSTLWR